MTHAELCNAVRTRLDQGESAGDVAKSLKILHRAVLAWMFDDKTFCEGCLATGKVQDKPCVHCNGKGSV